MWLEDSTNAIVLNELPGVAFKTTYWHPSIHIGYRRVAVHEFSYLISCGKLIAKGLDVGLSLGIILVAGTESYVDVAYVAALGIELVVALGAVVVLLYVGLADADNRVGNAACILLYVSEGALGVVTVEVVLCRQFVGGNSCSYEAGVFLDQSVQSHLILDFHPVLLREEGILLGSLLKTIVGDEVYEIRNDLRSLLTEHL